MRTFMFTLLFIAFSVTGFTQSVPGMRFNGNEDIMTYDPAVHDAVMHRFQQFYNQQQDDSINSMFSKEWLELALLVTTPPTLPARQRKGYPWDGNRMWEAGTCAKLMKREGRLLSFAYIGDMDDDKSVKLYKVQHEKTSYVMGFSLDQEHRYLTFRPGTSSRHIRKLVREHNRGVARL